MRRRAKADSAMYYYGKSGIWNDMTSYVNIIEDSHYQNVTSSGTMYSE